MNVDRSLVAVAFAVAWFLVGAVSVWAGRQRHNRALLIFGVIVLAIGAWNTLVTLFARPR